MQRKFLCIVVLLLFGLTASAQHSMYVCRQSLAEVFDISHVGEVSFRTDSFQVDRGAAYRVDEVDSIVFTPPALADVRERGWWGSAADGELRCRLRLENDSLGYAAEVCYTVEVADSVCTSVRCTISEVEGMSVQELWNFIATDVTDTNNPYIYVKQTKTGSRLVEEWLMNPTMILPTDCPVEPHDNCLEADLTDVLGQRPLAEVVAIVEAWAYQPPVVKERGMP